jgi:hypothetical protein
MDMEYQVSFVRKICAMETEILPRRISGLEIKCP